MARVTIYTRPFCGYCARAMALLSSKGAEVTEIEAGFDPGRRAEMVRRSGASTFPQVFIGEEHVGGCEELLALERDGVLDAKLSA
ncbi:MAG: glutaredoxin 3 [Caulobacteraceae bacterium]